MVCDKCVEYTRSLDFAISDGMQTLVFSHEGTAQDGHTVTANRHDVFLLIIILAKAFCLFFTPRKTVYF